MIFNIINKTKGSVISQSAKVADNFFLRLMGLMFRKGIGESEALIFYHAPSIHTFFMRFPIDIVFLNKEKRVIRICSAVKPWRAVFCANSFLTIEFPPNKISQGFLDIEDLLDLAPEAQTTIS